MEPEYPHWSFGVSYTRNQIKLKEILKFNHKPWLTDFKWKGAMNLDCYFNYLKDYMSNFNLKIFAPKNLLFLHWNQLYTLHVGAASFMQYNEDTVDYPLIQNFYNTNDIGIGYVPRNQCSVLIDAGIDKEEGVKWLLDNFVHKAQKEHWLKVNAELNK